MAPSACDAPMVAIVPLLAFCVNPPPCRTYTPVARYTVQLLLLTRPPTYVCGCRGVAGLQAVEGMSYWPGPLQNGTASAGGRGNVANGSGWTATPVSNGVVHGSEQVTFEGALTPPTVRTLLLPNWL